MIIHTPSYIREELKDSLTQKLIQKMPSWLEAECCHSSRLDYRGLREELPGRDQSSRRELLSQLEA
jgi:hypothetical protein